MQNVPRFKIEQIAVVTASTPRALALLAELGLDEWTTDVVFAKGEVFGDPGQNHADLHFNYQAGNGNDAQAGKPLELEVLDYHKNIKGETNWMDQNSSDRNSVSHLGMHCTAEELKQYRAFFADRGICVAQEVITESHTNEYIANSRRYNYVIFDTRDIIGVDLKFIVRLDIKGQPL